MPRLSLRQLEQHIPTCHQCPELRDYCAAVGRTKRRAFANSNYWARPIPSFGDHSASILIVGLAPAAHGANRTGRMFTGDRSGDFLYGALHRAGLCNKSTSIDVRDGLLLHGVYITAAVRCAPPDNKPTPLQLQNCQCFLLDEIAILCPQVIFCLGAIAWKATLSALRERAAPIPKPAPAFAHAKEITIADFTLLGCYHVSQQNTFTGRLTPAMIDAVLARAKAISGSMRRM